MRRKGFTLLELAIVLVVIGLLIALVVRGITLQSSARVKRVAADIRNVHTAVMVYYSKKGVYPGDTDGDGLIDNNAAGWDSLAAYNIAFNKPSPYGTYYLLGSRNSRNVIDVVVSNAEDRTEIDEILDDGVLNSGALKLIAPDTLSYIIE